MSLSNIQLCHVDPVDRANDVWSVTINGDAGVTQAVFRCSSERDAIKLRNAIRDCADYLHRVHDYSR